MEKRLERAVESETSDEDEIGMEHIGMASAFQDGVFDTFGDNADEDPTGITDDFGPCVAEMASVWDGEVLHAEPALDGDFVLFHEVGDATGEFIDDAGPIGLQSIHVDLGIADGNADLSPVLRFVENFR